MARGRGGHHKGGKRHFTNPDDLKVREEREKKEREWRRRAGEESESDESGEDEEDSSAEDESSSEEEDTGKAKGTEGLIEVANPNRAIKKVDKKALEVVGATSAVAGSGEASEGAGPKPELSRREREQLEKQRSREHYNKLHAEGKTALARADLARLALIRQQREDAAKRREVEKNVKDTVTKTAAVQKTAATKSSVSAVTETGPVPSKKAARK